MLAMKPYLWQFLLVSVAGWINRSQQDAIEYLREFENGNIGDEWIKLMRDFYRVGNSSIINNLNLTNIDSIMQKYFSSNS